MNIITLNIITMIKKLTFIFTAVLLLAFILMPKQSQALTVTPAIRELTVTAGEKTTAIIQLDNDELQQIQLTTQVVNFTAKDETGEPDLQIGSAPTDAALWLEVTKGPIVIGAGNKAEVVVTADVPAIAKAGGYYAAVLFSFSESAQTAKPNEVSIESKVAVPFLLTVKGTYQEAGQVATFSTADNRMSYTKGPIDFILRYQNTGDVHLKPVGTITVANMFGSPVKTIKVNEDQGAVLPGTIRQFEIPSWKNVGTGFGQYTATVKLTTGTISSSAAITFWVVSTTWLFAVIAVVIVLLIVLMTMTRKPLLKKSTPAKQ